MYKNNETARYVQSNAARFSFALWNINSHQYKEYEEIYNTPKASDLYP